MTFKFYIKGRSTQDILDLFMLPPSPIFDARRSRVTWMRVPGLRGDEIVVEALFADADGANTVEDFIAENEFSHPGLAVLSQEEFEVLQREAAERARQSQLVTVTGQRRDDRLGGVINTIQQIGPDGFAGCGDPTYRAPVLKDVG